jgi:hypothetical protein
MQTISQIFPQIFINIVISVICWVLFSMAVLSLPAILSGGGFLIPDLPFTRSAFYGLILGFFHGCIISGIIYLFKIDSLVGIIISSFVATEILTFFGIIVGMTIIILSPYTTGRPVESAGILITVFGNAAIFGAWFAFLSVLFIIPSIVAGITVRFISTNHY